MTNEIKPLAGNTVADLVAYLQQLPPDCRVDTLNVTDGGYQGDSTSWKYLDNSDLYYSAPWVSSSDGKSFPGYLEIGNKY